MEIKTLEQKPFSLTNDGNLELFFIGVGSAFTKRHYQTNLLIVKGNDHVLVDCGTRCSQAFYELGVPLTDVTHFLITHSNADHIGGLEEVSLMSKYALKKRPIMVINETYQNILWDMSLRGGAGYNEEEAGSILTFSDYWNVIRPVWAPGFPRETFRAKVGSIDLVIFRTKHIPDASLHWQFSFWSCGIIIDDRIMFTSDTQYDPDLLYDYDRKFELEAIFHDCQFYNGGVHASLDELQQLPVQYKQKMYLTHYGDEWEKYVKKVKKYGFAGLAKQHLSYIY